MRYLPGLNTLFFLSGSLSLGVVMTGITQKRFNERLIDKYLSGYSNEQLQRFDNVLMDKAVRSISD